MNGSIGSPAEQTRRSSEQRLLAILQNLVNELRDGGGGVRMDSHLDRDLGLDSLARVELLLRLEREFGASLPAARTPPPLLNGLAPGLRAAVTAEELMTDAQSGERPARAAGDIALLQYTSGSTGDPKGVILTHANLLANIRAMGEAVAVRPDKDVFVSWLPRGQDGGLIGACLGSLYYGMPLVLMSPLTFLARPTRWLRAIHRHRATLSAGPN